MTDPERKPDPPKAGSGLVDLLDQSARDALAGLERNLTRGLSAANAALTTPEGADLAPLLPATDLPELPVDDEPQRGGRPEAEPAEGRVTNLNEARPLGRMAVRLDREADLLRSIALRELARIGWLERLAVLVVATVVTGELLVAAAATFCGLTGSVDGRGGLFALAATVLALTGGGTAFVAARGRTAHRTLAEDALRRARDVEARLFRLGLVMEWRHAGPALYQDALVRLERDLSPPAPAELS